MNDATLAALAEEHPAVARAYVTAGPTVWIRPDPDAAPMLHRSAAIEQAGRLGPALAWHEPADGLRVAGISRTETDFLYREIFAEGAYLRKVGDLPPGAVVLDVGANIGMFTLRAALGSPGARVVAVEPVAELAEAVRINAELHGVDVAVVCAAAGDAEGEADFTFYPHNSVMSGRFADAAEDVAVLKGYLLTADGAADTAQLDRMVEGRLSPQRRRVPVTTVGAVAAAHDLDRIDLLKVDVEKAEAEVLNGVGDDLWPRIDRVVLEVHDIGGRLAAILRLLAGKGFVVGSDQDPRLALTPCHSVHAHRPGATGTSRPAAFSGGPALREITRDLRGRFGDRPARFVVTTGRPAADDSPPSPVRRTGRAGVLAEAWADLFGPEQVRPEADFFELGGTSLLALRLLDRVEKELGADALTAELIFANCTFGELTAVIEADNRTEPTHA